jgi:hypothetical protein
VDRTQERLLESINRLERDDVQEKTQQQDGQIAHGTPNHAEGEEMMPNSQYARLLQFSAAADSAEAHKI